MPLLVAVMGPTASGKSEVAEALAERYDAQLINADAFQVYRGFDIGTAKPLQRERYRLLDIKDPDEQFGLGEWIALALQELRSLFREHRNAILVGGTGLYIRALMDEYSDIRPRPDPQLRERLGRLDADAVYDELLKADPDAAAAVARSNPHRVRRALEKALGPPPMEVSLPPFTKVKIGIDTEPEVLDHRIRQRTEQMLESGWVEEVRELLARGVSTEAAAMAGIGYRTVAELVAGTKTREEAIEQIVLETRQYAKRQRTWLRSEKGLRLISGGDNSSLLAEAVTAIEAATASQ